MIALLASAVLAAAATERPRDPWVFRCVLDGRPRSVVVALAEDLWVSYDATQVAMVAAWKGDVELLGAVYDAVHGPQPEARGPRYCSGLEGPVWFAEVEGEILPLEPRWRGYAFVDGRVELRLEARLPDGRSVRVAETPERMRSLPQHERPFRIPAGLTGLVRSWRVEAPEGVGVLLRDAPLSPHRIVQNVTGMLADPTREGALVRLHTDTLTSVAYFFEAPTAVGEDRDAAGSQESAGER